MKSIIAQIQMLISFDPEGIFYFCLKRRNWLDIFYLKLFTPNINGKNNKVKTEAKKV
jgi:hypothetical protein